MDAELGVRTLAGDSVRLDTRHTHEHVRLDKDASAVRRPRIARLDDGHIEAAQELRQSVSAPISVDSGQ